MAPHDFEWSKLASSLLRSPIRSISMPAQEKKKRGEDIAMLAGGMPHPTLFPMVGLTVDNVPIEHNEPAGASAASALAQFGRAAAATPGEMREAQQYMSGYGFEPLRAWLKAELLPALHGAPRADDPARGWDVALSVGIDIVRHSPSLIDTPL